MHSKNLGFMSVLAVILVLGQLSATFAAESSETVIPVIDSNQKSNQNNIKANSSNGVSAVLPSSWFLGPVVRLQGEVVKLEKRLAKLNIPLNQLEPGALALTREMERIQKQTAELFLQLDITHADIRSLQTDVRSLRQPILDLKDPITKLREPVLLLRDPVRNLSSRVYKLDKSLLSVDSELVVLSTRLSQLDDHFRIFEDRFSQLDNRLAALSNQLADFRKILFWIFVAVPVSVVLGTVFLLLVMRQRAITS